MKVMIHAIPRRMWYVERFLIPSLTAQGISPVVYCDTEKRGNLGACLDSFRHIRGGGTWHIQDDVIISRRFAELAEANDTGVCNGFCHSLFEDDPTITGTVYAPDLWHGFPCVRIPDDMARDVVKWVETAQHDSWCSLHIKRNAGDDYLFREYFNTVHGRETARNIAPNMVDHVDYLLGGSTISEYHDYYRRADLFEDLDLVDELEKKIKSLNDRR